MNNKSSFKIVSLLIVFLFILLNLNCSSPESTFEKAKELDTVEAYKSFIKKYPDNSLCKEAQKQIEKFLFENAKLSNSIDSLKAFIERHPNSELLNEAQKELLSLEEELKIFNERDNKNNDEDILNSLINYLQSYPNGRFYNQAKAEIDTLKNSIIGVYINNAEMHEKSALNNEDKNVAAKEYIKAGSNYEKAVQINETVGDEAKSMYKRAAFAYYQAARMFQMASMNVVAAQFSQSVRGKISNREMRENTYKAIIPLNASKELYYGKSVALFKNAGMEEHANWMIENGKIKVFTLEDLDSDSTSNQ